MVDSEAIIRSVKKFRAIWDLDIEGYHNKHIKDEAWNGVCLELVDDWTNLSEGEKYVKQLELKKKWNNIRDYYKKLLSETRPGDQEVRAKKRRYLYSDILEFIRPVYDKKRVESTNSNDSNISAGENNDSDDNQDSGTEAQDPQISYPFVSVPKMKSINIEVQSKLNQTHKDQKHKSKSSMTYFEKTIIKTLENKMASDDDPDLLFLKSILPDMKKLKPKQKFDFKMGIMELYRNISENQSDRKDCGHHKLFHDHDHGYHVPDHEHNHLHDQDDNDFSINHDMPQVKVETVRLSVDDDSYHSIQFSDV